MTKAKSLTTICIDEPTWRRKVKSLAWRLFNRLENNNNSDPTTNGELLLLARLTPAFPDETIICFDVGANVGDYTSALLRCLVTTEKRGQVHIFEPLPSSFGILQEKFGDHADMLLNPFGASDDDEESIIYYDRDASSLASLYPRHFQNSALTMEASIQLRRLDEYIAQSGVNHIHILKMDVEGHELKVLQGLGNALSPDFIDVLQFEYGGANLDARTCLKELYRLLELSGFDLYKVMPRYLERRSYLSRMDNFQYANYVALSPSFLTALKTTSDA